MSLKDFNNGLDDACEGNFRKSYQNNPDYIEGYSYGEDINEEDEKLEIEDLQKRDEIFESGADIKIKPIKRKKKTLPEVIPPEEVAGYVEKTLRDDYASNS